MMDSTDVFAAEAEFETREHGSFRIFVTDPVVVGGEHVALVKGDVLGQHSVLCRVASSCLTSTALGSADCDCVDQIDLALSLICDVGSGVFLYLSQEGRGHGLVTKIRALEQKNRGLDTLAAVEALGLPADVRDYRSAAAMLDALGIHSVRLLTNNLAKLLSITNAGVDVREVRPLIADAPPRAQRHLAAKLARFHIGSMSS